MEIGESTKLLRKYTGGNTVQTEHREVVVIYARCAKEREAQMKASRNAAMSGIVMGHGVIEAFDDLGDANKAAQRCSEPGSADCDQHRWRMPGERSYLSSPLRMCNSS